ncbi:MAG: hypothetical protein IPK97_20205 [Ahniella sp.]|nr:hypothetical protein [Ahniella sp.]
MVEIGGQVPGEDPGTGFRAFGEGLSVSSDGGKVSFWASWGTQTFQKTLLCPTDGNPDIVAYCNQLHPTGLVVNIPVNQGIFVHDAATGVTTRVARTGAEGIEDFVFWGFSGRPPGVGGGDEPGTELARWRSSAFAALSPIANGSAFVAFKAQRNGLDGLFLREGLSFQLQLQTIAQVNVTSGTAIDPMAPAGSLISSVGIEREGFRNGRVAVNLGMLYVDPMDPDTTVGWGGIYVAPVAVSLIFQDGFE